LARSGRRELRNRLTVLMTHLLKCRLRPKKRSPSWLATIAEQRDQIAQLIEESPSPQVYPAQILDRCYPAARRKAAEQMRIGEDTLPHRCPFGIGDVLAPGWLPARQELDAQPGPASL
jgi:Domain of unknown function DUF29